MVALWVAVAVLSLAVVLLVCKILSMQRAAREITIAFAEHLQSDTNTLIGVSTRDRYVRALAIAINRELRTLREQRHRYQNGDRELKNAVTNISHDLRTPLTAICGYLELLEKEEKSPNVARYLEIIAGRIEAMRLLAEELFRHSVILSSAEQALAEPIDLRGALQESITAFYGALTARGIVPQITMTESAVMRRADRQALSRVLGNVLNNALKYSDGDLTITLSDDGEMMFANHALFLSKVQVQKLFDRFFSVESGRTSAGVGLSITKTLVEHMGGTIGAEYTDGMLFVRIKI